MRTFRQSLSSVALLMALLPGASRAQDVDPALQEALEKTERLLNDPALRKAVATAQSQAADELARSVAGSPENTADLYKLTAEVMRTLTEQTGGDATKMAALLEKARTHPELLTAKLTSAERTHLSALAKKIEATQAAPKPKEAGPVAPETGKETVPHTNP